MTQANSNTSRGWVFDLVNAISNDLSVSNHLHEALYGVQRDIDDGDTSKELGALRDSYIELIKLSLDIRRKKMTFLKDNADTYNEKMWCPLKHAIESYMETMEVWQATFDPKMYELMMSTTSMMAGVLSLFLGMELEVCARCVADALKSGASVVVDDSVEVGSVKTST